MIIRINVPIYVTSYFLVHKRVWRSSNHVLKLLLKGDFCPHYFSLSKLWSRVKRRFNVIINIIRRKDRDRRTGNRLFLAHENILKTFLDISSANDSTCFFRWCERVSGFIFSSRGSSPISAISIPPRTFCVPSRSWDFNFTNFQWPVINLPHW